jgi:hypothetical protein
MPIRVPWLNDPPDLMAAPQSGPTFLSGLRGRLRASGIHLGASLAVSVVLILLITQLWYPRPFFSIASGRDIFFLILGCDLILGPLLTLVVFDLRKPRRELIRDIALIGLIQVVAMGYGVRSLLQARPAFIVYNAGQFNVTLANELVEDPGDHAANPRAPIPVPWFGPKVIAARGPMDTDARNRLIFSAVEGRGDVYQMPQYFLPYDDAKAEILQRARTPEKLAQELHLPVDELAAAASRYASAKVTTGLLPLVVRHTLAVAVVDSTNGQFLGVESLPKQ